MSTESNPSPADPDGGVNPYEGWELRRYPSTSLLTPRGVRRARKILLKKGFPFALNNWLSGTLTVDRNRYPDPERAYDICVDRIGRCMNRLARKYPIRAYARKTEFYAPDNMGRSYAHFHLLIDCGPLIPVEVLEKTWKLGIVHVHRIDDANPGREFYYFTKLVQHAPGWFLNRPSIRIIQPSRGFYPCEFRAKPARHGSVRRGSRRRLPRESIAERLKRHEHKGVIVRRLRDGRVIRYTVDLEKPWDEVRNEFLKMQEFGQTDHPDPSQNSIPILSAEALGKIPIRGSSRKK